MIASHDEQPMLGVVNSGAARTVASFRRLAALDVEVGCLGHGAPSLKGAHAPLERAAARLGVWR